MHLMLQFGAAKDDKIKEGEVEYVIGTKSYIKITKNKFGPKFNSIPCYVDTRKLGIIDDVKSFWLYMTESKFIPPKGGWYELTELINDLEEKYFPGEEILDKEALAPFIDKKFRENNLLEAIKKDKSLFYLLQVYLIEKITDIYPANSLNTNSYRQSLIDNSIYFKKKNVPVRQLEENDLIDMTDKIVTEDEGEDE